MSIVGCAGTELSGRLTLDGINLAHIVACIAHGRELKGQAYRVVMASTMIAAIGDEDQARGRGASRCGS